MRTCACARTHAFACVSVSASVCVCVCVNSLRDADEREALEDYQRLWCERFNAERLQLADAYIEETREDVEEIPEEWVDDQTEPLEKPADNDPSPIGKSSRPPSASIIPPIPDRKRPTTILEQIESGKHAIQGMGCACDFISDHHRVLVFESRIELDEQLT